MYISAYFSSDTCTIVTNFWLIVFKMCSGVLKSVLFFTFFDSPTCCAFAFW